MKAFPEVVQTAWANREGPIVLATVDADGFPNAIYAGSVGEFGDDALVVADNYFHKTRANILAGSKGALLFITKERISYQVKGIFTYHTAGPVFEAMKQWNPAKHPGHAAAALKVERIYGGAAQLL
ncbi:MAG: pyridoxamine 5'-phosphate oxidase family protein [Opitutaceae bacterium]|nr:pyridoxamine 5'-phosphate oxidase family protein [Opitutaceae bacterium]